MKRQNGIWKKNTNTESYLCLWFAHLLDDDNVFIECLVCLRLHRKKKSQESDGERSRFSA